MAKVAFAKLGVKTNTDTKELPWNNCKIEVKQYLPINEKLEMIEDVMNRASSDENMFVNQMKVDTFLDLKILEHYTNITFTDKQKEEVWKLYDAAVSSGLLAAVKAEIPKDELNELTFGASAIIDEYYRYRTSALGIMDSISKNYKDTQYDVEQIRTTLAGTEGMEFLKEVLDKMG